MQFQDIIGQRTLINQLTSIIDAGRISHAQLFLGQNGYGSMALALAYAQYLNCENRQHYDEGHDGLRADSCGECPHCKKYQQLSHSDLHIFFPTTATSSVKSNPASADFQDKFREFMQERNYYATLNDWFSYLNVENKQGAINVRDAKAMGDIIGLKAYESAYKVILIWMAEKMREDAANKILKMLEEPTPNTLFLLVTESQDNMLDTIISRTQLVRVDRIDNESISNAVAQMTLQNPSFNVAAAEGNYIEAVNLIQKSEQEQLFGQLFVDWMRQLFKLNMASLSAWVDQMASMGREQQKQFLRYAMDALRACFLSTASGIRLDYKLQFGDEKFNNSFPQFITANNIERLNEDFNQTIYAIERNAKPKLAFMELSFRISKALKKR